MKYKPTPILKGSMGTDSILQLRRKKVSGRLKRSKQTKHTDTFKQMGVL